MFLVPQGNYFFLFAVADNEVWAGYDVMLDVFPALKSVGESDKSDMLIRHQIPEIQIETAK